MNIKEIKGNLLEFPEGIQVIAHQANTECIMGSGIAGQIRVQIPSLKQADDIFYIPKGAKRLGHASFTYFYSPEPNMRYVMGFNLYGQRLGGYDNDGNRIESLSKYGIPTDYDALQGALFSMRNKLCHTHIFNILDCKTPVKIGFPRLMGCALGGGSWDKVLELITNVFRNYNVDIYIVDFND